MDKLRDVQDFLASLEEEGSERDAESAIYYLQRFIAEFPGYSVEHLTLSELLANLFDKLHYIRLHQ